MLLAVLLLGPLALITGIWARRRARRSGRVGRLAAIAFAVGVAETALAVAFWIVYFAALAPILALPSL